MNDTELRAEVERRLDRPFADVQERLIELFDLEWDDVETVIETSAVQQEASEVDVIVGLVARAEAKPAVHDRVRHSVIKWIGKPWREREDPWDRFKHRVPEPPPTDTGPDDLEEWAPFRTEAAEED